MCLVSNLMKCRRAPSVILYTASSPILIRTQLENERESEMERKGEREIIHYFVVHLKKNSIRKEREREKAREKERNK